MIRMLWRGLAGLVAVGRASPARAEWRRAESSNFILFGDAFGIAAARSASCCSRISTGCCARSPRSRSRRRRTSSTSISSAGMTTSNVIRTVPRRRCRLLHRDARRHRRLRRRQSGAGADNQILFHEYAHHFMRQSTPSSIRPGTSEGFAEYFATARFTARTDRHRQLLRRAGPMRSCSGSWLPMERILSGGPMGLNREEMAAYYAQSWLLTHYFYSTPERQAALARLSCGARRGDARPRRCSARPASPSTAERRAPALHPRRPASAIADWTARRALPRVPCGHGYPAAAFGRRPDACSRRRSGSASARTSRRLPAAHPGRGGAPSGRSVRDAGARPCRAAATATAQPADRLLDRLLGGRAERCRAALPQGHAPPDGSPRGDDPPENAGATARAMVHAARIAPIPNHFQTLYRFAQSLRGEPEFRLREYAQRAAARAPARAAGAEITMNAAVAADRARRICRGDRLLAPLAGDPARYRPRPRRRGG